MLQGGSRSSKHGSHAPSGSVGPQNSVSLRRLTRQQSSRIGLVHEMKSSSQTALRAQDEKGRHGADDERAEPERSSRRKDARWLSEVRALGPLALGLEDVGERELVAGREARAQVPHIREGGRVDLLGDEVNGRANVEVGVDAVEVVDEVGRGGEGETLICKKRLVRRQRGGSDEPSQVR